MSPVFCVVGPTASGKSHLALGLAKEIGGFIINADSLQVYKDLPLLTARPSPQDEAHVSHHLYGFLGPHDTYSVARWLEDVAPLLARLIPEGRPVIFVGGTGLYIKALQEGLAPVPVIDPDTRTRVRALYESQGFEALQELWGEIGEEVLGPCPKDPQRAQRALEVYLATQRPLSFWQQTPQQPLAPNAKIIYAVRPKDELLERAQARLEAVFDPSRQEMEGLMIDHPNLETAPLMQALGAKE
ncbi:MAG: tRNA (adenosine(37)-N6)-dimethylallyltransferase MiaA, partial [Proteobacteria bacterium]|nr:tRNA (adenosine(37)-N6)-dimethylallyltransferase MiaA [Pseudomonadota bacterium]